MVKVAFDKELALAGHFLLRHLDPGDLRRLAATTTLAHYPPQALIFQKGDPGTGMMAVLRGRVKICTHSVDGKELVLNIIGRGGVFGEVALLDGEPRSADAFAAEESDLLVLERAQFLPFLSQHPDVALRIITLLCQRLRQTSEHLEDAMFLEAQSRLARCLLRLGRAFGKEEGAHTRIDIKLSQQQLGNLIGLSRESVNKYLGEWQREGVIGVASGFITLHDPEALDDLAAAGE